MSEPILLLRPREATQIQFLLGLVSTGKRAEDILGRRLDATGDREAYVKAMDQLDAIADRLLETISPEKLSSLSLNLRHQELRIVTKAPADSSRFDCSLVPNAALYDLCATASHWECMTCDGEASDMAKCRLRKTLRQIVTVDFEDEGGVCFARKLEWEG